MLAYSTVRDLTRNPSKRPFSITNQAMNFLEAARLGKSRRVPGLTETNSTLGQNHFSRALSRRGDWFPKLAIPGWGHADLSLEGLAKGHF
jgi:hypothetical protein